MRISYVKHPIALTLDSASSTFARHAIELENQAPWDGGKVDRERERQVRRVMEYAIGAVTVSVAGLEGMVNEMLEGATEMLDGTRSVIIGAATSWPKNLTSEALRRWQNCWTRGIPDRGFDALQKIQTALELADLPPLPEDRGSAQHLHALIKLRNELVHSRPAMRVHLGPADKRDILERRLAGKFKPSTMLPETYNFIWYRCLSADCARWAVLTAAAVQNDFFQHLGIPMTVEPALPEVGS